MDRCVGAPSGNFMLLRFGSRSEITELSGSKDVRTFKKGRKKLELLVGT